MKIHILAVSLILLGIFSGCALFDELLEPGDLNYIINRNTNDTTSPALIITSLTNGQEVGAPYIFEGTVSDSGSGVKAVYVKLDNGSYHTVPVTNGIWSTNISTSIYGVHTNYAYAVDNVSNLSIVSSVWVVRASNPLIAIISPANLVSTNIQNITVSGSAFIDPPYNILKVQVQLNDGAWIDATGTTNWSKPVVLVYGINTLKARSIGDNNKTNESALNTVWFFDKLVSYDGAADGNFGYSVAVSADGNTVIAGAYGDDDNGINSGSAYRFKWDGSSWATNKFVAYDGGAGERFGCSVAVSPDGNTVVIGSFYDDYMTNSSGSVYRFKWNGSSWDTIKFVAHDWGLGHNLGCSVAVSADGNTIVAGAYGDTTNGFLSGSVYRFKWNGSVWETNKFVPHDGIAWDFFGFSVAVSADGDTVVAGASRDDDMGTDSGSVYYFKWTGSEWETNKFVPHDGIGWAYFGYSVAVSSNGNTVVAGAYSDNSKGAVYRFVWNGSAWETNKITAYDGAFNDYFGYSVAVSADGDTVVAGAPSDDVDLNNDQGSAYRFYWNGSSWATNKIAAYDGVWGDYFGGSVAVSADGNTVIAGAYNDDDKGDESGSIHRFRW